jgi:MFS family permease
MRETSASGGRVLAAWTVASLFFFYAFVHRVSPSVMVEELMRDFAVGAAVLGNLSAFYFYAYAGLQIPVGVLMDRIGPRRLTTAAAALCTFGSLLFATSDTVMLASLGRALIGAGAGFSFVAALTIATQWLPPHRFAQFGGLTQAAGMMGALFGQAPLAAAVVEIGWRPTILVVGALGAVLALALWLLVPERPRPVTAPTRPVDGLRHVVANPQTWLNAVFGLSMTGPMLAFAGLWGVPWLVTVYGMERPAAAAALSVMFIGWGIGCPILGFVSDRMGRRKPFMAVGAAVAAITLAVVLYVPDLPLAAMSALLIAHGVGGSAMILGFACVRENNAPTAAGSAYGFINTAVVGSGALFQPLIGYLLDMNWDGTILAGARIYSADAYEVAFAVLPVGCAIGVLAALAGRETYARQQAPMTRPLAV